MGKKYVFLRPYFAGRGWLEGLIKYFLDKRKKIFGG
jgi:hypothetical protein